MMKKPEEPVKKDKSKKFEMMKQCCDGQAEFLDCCSEMRKMWEQLHEISQEKDVKNKNFNGER